MVLLGLLLLVRRAGEEVSQKLARRLDLLRRAWEVWRVLVWAMVVLMVVRWWWRWVWKVLRLAVYVGVGVGVGEDFVVGSRVDLGFGG